MNVNDCHVIKDVSDEMFTFLSDLIEASRIDEHMVYREAELDELWRMLHTERAIASGMLAKQLSIKIDIVTEVHDMIGQSANMAVALAAADRLRKAVV
jgi:hypothetical protein